MTYDEILKGHAAGKFFAGSSREDATDCGVVAFDTREEAEEYCRCRFSDQNDIRVVGIETADMEVTDPRGHYSGSGRQYSLIPMIYPDIEEA